MKKAGREISPVEITGRKIATTFWGEAWCKNLEAYSDYANRLPRGRTYVRNGSLLDLQIEAGCVRALVSGSDLYRVEIAIERLKKKRWTEIKGRCGGQIDSLVELLQGSISGNVMEIVTRKGEGLFPSPREISLDCSCPDWATMCKHVAATLYAVGARLDHRPELLFTLRGVDPLELVESAVDQGVQSRKRRAGRVLKTRELSAVFGVDIDMGGGIDSDSGAASADGGTRSDGEVGPTRRPARTRKPAASGTRKKPAGKSATTKSPAGRSPARRSAANKKRAVKKATRKKAGAKASAGAQVAKKTQKKTPNTSTASRKAAGRKPSATTSSMKASSMKTSSAKKSSAKKTAAKKSSAKKSDAAKAGPGRTTAEKRTEKASAFKTASRKKRVAKKATRKVRRSGG